MCTSSSKQRGLWPVRPVCPGYKTLANVDGVAQPAAVQISVMDTPLDHAHDEAMPLVEWARTPMGALQAQEEYASMTASTIH